MHGLTHCLFWRHLYAIFFSNNFAHITITITALFIDCNKNLFLHLRGHATCERSSYVFFREGDSFQLFRSTLSSSESTCKSAVLADAEYKIERYTIRASEVGLKVTVWQKIWSYIYATKNASTMPLCTNTRDKTKRAKQVYISQEMYVTCCRLPLPPARRSLSGTSPLMSKGGVYMCLLSTWVLLYSTSKLQNRISAHLIHVRTQDYSFVTVCQGTELLILVRSTKI